VAGDLEFWSGPLCGDGQGYTQVFVMYPPPSPGGPAVTVPPTDALDESVPGPRTEVPWLALTGLALTSLGALLLARPRRNGNGLEGS